MLGGTLTLLPWMKGAIFRIKRGGVSNLSFFLAQHNTSSVHQLKGACNLIIGSNKTGHV